MTAASLTEANAARWTKVHVKAEKRASFAAVAKRLVAAKARYAGVEASTGVPWFVIAVIHERESSQRWDRSIAQGDPWNAKSVHVPKGRGPFASWEEAAKDALMKCAPFAGKWTDWSPGGTMTLLEHYNGLGYANKGRPSPYIWAGTDQYVKGKYVADGKYDPGVVDQQLGCAGLILAMQAIDASVVFAGDEAAADVGDDSTAVAPDEVAGGGDAKTSATSIADPELRAVQASLKAMNYNPGSPEGNWGGMTAGALSGFLNDRGSSIPAPTSDEMFDASRDLIQAEIALAESEGFKRPVSAERANADPKVVAQIEPGIVPVRRNFFASAWAAVVAFVSAIGTAISSYLQSAWDWITNNKDSIPTDPGYLSMAWGYVGKVPVAVWIFMAAGGLTFIAWNSFNSARKITESVQTGARQ